MDSRNMEALALLRFMSVMIALFCFFLVSKKMERLEVLSQDPPTYTDDIRPIFERTCAVCHNRTPFNWMEYKTAYRYRKRIYNRVVFRRNMPPSYWQKQPTEDERKLIGEWVKTGAKE